MFLVDKPYISNFLKQTVRDHDIPVVGTDIAGKLGLYEGTIIISEDDAIALLHESDTLPVYATSENAIGWITDKLSFTKLPDHIELFKNKLKFRQITQSIFPDFYYREVRFENLPEMEFNEIPLPVVIKPTVGFFSMGVHKIGNLDEWWTAIESITAEIKIVKDLYPKEVLNTGSFIIEQCIDGEEFAMDAYFDANGEPVILGILRHAFSSDTDVSDRVYTTSKEIIEANLAEFISFAGKIGKVTGVKNFPVHIELRRDSQGALLPIEVNPMRFGGWCTTADLTFLAYGLNPYLCYHKNQKPDWPTLLAGKEGTLYSIVILDNSTGIDVSEIRSFDYDKLLEDFKNPLELRKIDYREYPVFGILFTETRADNMVELENILNSDLNEFIIRK